MNVFPIRNTQKFTHEKPENVVLDRGSDVSNNGTQSYPIWSAATQNSYCFPWCAMVRRPRDVIRRWYKRGKFTYSPSSTLVHSTYMTVWGIESLQYIKHTNRTLLLFVQNYTATEIVNWFVAYSRTKRLYVPFVKPQSYSSSSSGLMACECVHERVRWPNCYQLMWKKVSTTNSFWPLQV